MDTQAAFLHVCMRYNAIFPRLFFPLPPNPFNLDQTRSFRPLISHMHTNNHVQLAVGGINRPMSYALGLANIGVGGALSRLETPPQFQVLNLVSIAVWDSLSVYHPTAAPVYPHGIARRPAAEATERNLNTGMCTRQTVVVCALVRLSVCCCSNGDWE